MSLNDFELGKILGKGAFASVILVTRKVDRKIYAMKRINIAKMDQSEREGALNEIRILASLSHPNIIGYKEAFFDEMSKTLNIVMEYADDGDIDKKIKDNLKKRNLFTEETIWSWIIQILEGLKYLHDNKIMHRDLKCANLFLMKSGLLKLGDLNVSKIAKLGIAQTQTGTPYYISPEIWEEKPYDYKCDIWSVGCIIYEMCTLRPPFRGTSLKELYRNIKNGYYLPISNNYSNDIKDIISMMLIIDNKKRASAEELLNSNIIKKWVKIIKGDYNNQIREEIGNNLGKNSKVNLIKTIKVPKNLGDINRLLPKKNYNPTEEMMKNDKYEIMKETMKKGKKEFDNDNNIKKIDLRWLDEGNDRYNKNNNNIVNNNNYNNKYIYNNNDRQHTPNIGKYNYLNKYDNNMRLIKKDNENNYIKNNYNYDPRRNYDYCKKDINNNYNKDINNNYNNNYNNINNNYNNKKRYDDYYYKDLNNINNEQYNYRNNNNYRNNYEKVNQNYKDNRYVNNNIYNNQIDYKNNNYIKNDYNERFNYNKYNNNYIGNQIKNDEKNLTPNKYRYQNNERNYNNYNNNRTPNKINNNNDYNNNYNNYNYKKENYNYNKNNYQNDCNQNNRNDRYNNLYLNREKYPNNNNFNKRKANRYKYIFTDEEETSQNNNYERRNNADNLNRNDYHQYNHRNNNYKNYYNDNRNIGPRYNLYDFRYNNDNNNYNKERDNDEIKIIYQKINYNNYCQQNNFDRKRNYHYYRENGYYNYNQAMENHQNIYNNDNNDYYYKDHKRFGYY